MIRQLIREMLLTEKVYGAQAVVYHGSRTAPDVFVPALLNDTFDPGQGSGAMYGKGLYCVYDLGETKTAFGEYGGYVYKFKVNLYGFICFDPEVAFLVYKRPLSPVEQAQELGLDETLVEKLKGIRIRAGFTSESALPASTFLKGKVKGLIFTGANDGRVAVVYDSTAAIPFAWKRVGNKNWNSIDKSSLKSALRKSAERERETGRDWEAEKYGDDPEALLAKLSKLSVDKRVVKGDLDFRGTSITSLPAGLQVGGNLDISNTSITSLPAGLRVSGNLDLYGISITSLPADLKVDGYLNLSYTSITSLPAGLKVGGDLNLRNASITSLPADLKVGGTLNLRNASITSLPADLKVGGNLDLSGTKITSLPAGLKVGLGVLGFSGDKSQVPQHLMNKLG